METPELHLVLIFVSTPNHRYITYGDGIGNLQVRVVGSAKTVRVVLLTIYGAWNVSSVFGGKYSQFREERQWLLFRSILCIFQCQRQEHKVSMKSGIHR